MFRTVGAFKRSQNTRWNYNLRATANSTAHLLELKAALYCIVINYENWNRELCSWSDIEEIKNSIFLFLHCL